jgi:hypothetical protein
MEIVSHFDDDVRKKFIEYMDRNYKEVDENAEFPKPLARSLS